MGADPLTMPTPKPPLAVAPAEDAAADCLLVEDEGGRKPREDGNIALALRIRVNISGGLATAKGNGLPRAGDRTRRCCC